MRRFLSLFAIALLSTGLSAQNVNPTVQVTNDYMTRMSKVKKSGVGFSVPDTLYDFDYEFDYSVFESPYKGAYEFSPYMLRMTPEPVPYVPKSFYLKLGAGYSLHPELDLVYSPVVKDKFSLNLFGKASGFYGQYSGMDSSMAAYDRYSGYDFSDYAGIGGCSVFSKSQFSFTLGHNGAFANLNPWSGSEDGASMAYNSGFADFRLKSKDDDGVVFCYDVGVNARYGMDACTNDNLTAKELDVNADLSLGVSVRHRYKFLMDARVEFENLKGNTPAAFNMIDLKPHLEFTLGPVFLDAGLKVDFVGTQINLYPDVHAECSIGEKHVFTVYADVLGGDRLNTYHDLKMWNHRMNSTYGEVSYSHTKLKASLGFRGYASTHFSYDLSGGYGKYGNSMMECLTDCLTTESGYREGFLYADYDMFYGDAGLYWKSERFDATANVAYRKLMSVSQTQSAAVDFPMISGGLTLKYNFARRLFFGISADGQTERKILSEDSAVSVPGFVDLGLNAEYKFSSKFGFWLKGGNLLGQPLRKSLLYVEKSPFVTVGVILSL